MDRQKRYRQKMGFIAEKTGEIPQKFADPLAVDATLYKVQTAIDATMDVLAMLVKDKGLEVSDDYSNIKKLVHAKVLNQKLSEGLIMLNGLRNAIVHKYNSFEEETVTENIEEIKQILENFLEKTENELKAIFK